jgi:hypothetical protein
VLPFAADGEGAGRQPPERSANHGCCGGGSDPETLQACVGEGGTGALSLFLFCGSVSILGFSFLSCGRVRLRRADGLVRVGRSADLGSRMFD